LLLTAAHLFAPLAAAQATWVGKTVILKTNKVKLTRAEGVGKKGDVQLRDITFLVLAERDGFLQVNDGHGSVGWFDKADAILPNDAVAYFSARLEKSDKDVAAFNGRASAHQLKGDFYLAVKDYTQALSLQPQAPVFTNRGGIYLENLKELDKAIADFNDAIRLDPKYASAYLNRAKAWAEKRDFVKSVADFTEAIKLAPHYVAAYYNRGTAYSSMKEYDKAIADFSEVIRLDAKFVRAYVNRGAAWIAKQDHDKAIADLNEAAQLAPKEYLIYYNRAIAWNAKKEVAKAMADYNEVLQLNEKFAPAYNARARIWATCPKAELRNGKKAVESAQQALKLDPKNIRYLDTLAAAHAEAGNFAEAVRAQQKVLEDPQYQADQSARARLELYRAKKPFRQK
jgi:tetratricopeptide (TPR) repeat protein